MNRNSLTAAYLLVWGGSSGLGWLASGWEVSLILGLAGIIVCGPLILAVHHDSIFKIFLAGGLGIGFLLVSFVVGDVLWECHLMPRDGSLALATASCLLGQWTLAPRPNLLALLSFMLIVSVISLVELWHTSWTPLQAVLTMTLPNAILLLLPLVSGRRERARARVEESDPLTDLCEASD